MYRYVKRCMDVLVSIIMLLTLGPVLVFISFVNLVNSGLPVLFKQKRPGLNGQLFDLYKFRTMSNERGHDGNLLPDNKRLTKFGQFLRKTSLDELPSLFNVLKGDMSLVGPRPLLIKYLPYYTKRERIRHNVRPGLTGLAQVSGRNNLDWGERLEKDVEYVESLSFFLDVKIIVKTIAIVLLRKNVELNAIDDLDVYRNKKKHQVS